MFVAHSILTSGHIYNENPGLLECDAVLLGEWFLMFQRNTVPLFSRVRLPKKNCGLLDP